MYRHNALLNCAQTCCSKRYQLCSLRELPHRQRLRPAGAVFAGTATQATAVSRWGCLCGDCHTGNGCIPLGLSLRGLPHRQRLCPAGAVFAGTATQATVVSRWGRLCGDCHAGNDCVPLGPSLWELPHRQRLCPAGAVFPTSLICRTESIFSYITSSVSLLVGLSHFVEFKWPI
jgi:hypothetical protein